MASLPAPCPSPPPSQPNRAARRHPQSAYVGTTEAAAYLGVNVKMVRALIASGDLPAYRIGNRILRIKRADLESPLKPVPSAETR